MMKTSRLLQTLSLSVSLMAGVCFNSLAFAQNSQNLRGVICEKNDAGRVRDCRQDEMRQMIRALKAAKAAGETEKLSLGQRANQVGKGLLVVGGTWFSTSLVMAIVDAEFDMAATRVLSSALGSLIHFNIRGGWEIPTRIVEGYLFKGLLIGGAATAVGGVMTFLTPSSAADGTLTGYYTSDENFGKLMDLPEEQILALVEKDSRLGNKIVTVSAVALKLAN